MVELLPRPGVFSVIRHACRFGMRVPRGTARVAGGLGVERSVGAGPAAVHYSTSASLSSGRVGRRRQQLTAQLCAAISCGIAAQR
eukprot:15485510-Alexandrium_andersonii.AAC.1